MSEFVADKISVLADLLREIVERGAVDNAMLLDVARDLDGLSRDVETQNTDKRLYVWVACRRCGTRSYLSVKGMTVRWGGCQE